MQNGTSLRSGDMNDPKSGITAAEVMLQLDRIVHNQQFERADRSKAILSFVVAEMLAGRSDRIKAYTIATLVLNRDADFDPQVNPIVRMEAGQLRRRLDRYYATDGAEDDLVIAVPKGGYVPSFSRRKLKSNDVPNGKMTPSGQPGVPALWRRIGARLFPDGSTRLAGIGILAAVPAAVVAMLMINGPARTAETWSSDIPRILVVPFLSTDRTAEADIAAGLHEEIKHYLLRYDMVQLAADTQAGNSVQPGSYLVLSGTVRSSEGRTRVAIRLANPVTDTLAWSDAIEHQEVGEPVFDIQHMLAAQVAAAAAAPYGGVSQVTFSPELPAQLGNGVYTCRFFTFKYRLTTSLQALRQARDCLERNRMEEPDRSEILALSSLVFLDAVKLFPGATDEEKAAALMAARDAARKAVDLAPRSPTALQALAAVDLFEGRLDEAAALLRFGLSLTPEDPELLASLGLVLGASGDWSQTAALTETAVTRTVLPPGWYKLVSAASDYARRNYESALRNAERADMRDSPLAKYFMVAALTNLNRQDEAQHLAEQIASGERSFGGDAAARDLKSFGFPASLASAVGDRISKLIGQRDVSALAPDRKAEQPRFTQSD
ncbi:TolB-like protein/tetratricopeptide (TPR) repeat protein [Skermanella aerolata]|uniref:hypothetical protein n=1 Tax=Skermanella aerolata TaxID=393310 RepID=UPI003D255DB2